MVIESERDLDTDMRTICFTTTFDQIPTETSTFWTKGFLNRKQHRSDHMHVRNRVIRLEGALKEGDFT